MIIDRIKVHNKLNQKCAYCGECITLKEMQVDHVIPKAFFERYTEVRRDFIPLFLKHLTSEDVNHIDNLHPSCRVCNKWKSAHHLELFRSELQEQVKRLNLYSSNYRIAKKFGMIKEAVKPIVFYFEELKPTYPKI